MCSSGVEIGRTEAVVRTPWSGLRLRLLSGTSRTHLLLEMMPRAAKAGGGDAAAVHAVVDSWNKIEGVRHVRGIAGKRGTTIKARLADPDWRDNWQAALERVGRSSFCKGGGDQGWVADLDWFLKPDILTKIMEGKYDDRASTPKSRTARRAGPIDRRRGAESPAI